MYGSVIVRGRTQRVCWHDEIKTAVKRKEGLAASDVNGNRKLFWKEVSNAKGGKVESCSRIKDGNGSLAQGEGEVQRI